MSWQDVIVLGIAVFGGLGVLFLAFYVFVVLKSLSFVAKCDREDDLGRPTHGAAGKSILRDELEKRRRRYR